jgi:putative ABC transport system permease protein
MMTLETIRSAWRSLASNRMRTALTGLGMMIGVAAVVAVLSVGVGAQTQVEGRIRALGTNLLTVRPESGSAGGVRLGLVQTLTVEDAGALAEIPGISAISPERSANAQVRYREQNRSAAVIGVLSEYLQVRSVEVAQGLGFSDADLRGRRRVAIIGATLATEFFGETSPLGERIQVKGVPFTVIGVLAPKGESFTSPDETVLVPLTTHEGVLFGQRHLNGIALAVETEGEMASVQAAATDLLRLRHGLRADQDDDFVIRSQTEMLATMNSVTGTFTAMLGGVAAVSLLVGGIGIMNIMLVSVRERTREIGVRMAVGARRRDILLQFLVESVVVSLFGGLLGLALGYGTAVLIANVAGWPTIVPTYALVLSLVVSVSVGLVFGVGPARRAARLDPVEALRQE